MRSEVLVMYSTPFPFIADSVICTKGDVWIMVLDFCHGHLNYYLASLSCLHDVLGGHCLYSYLLCRSTEVFLQSADCRVVFWNHISYHAKCSQRSRLVESSQMLSILGYLCFNSPCVPSLLNRNHNSFSFTETCFWLRFLP